MTTILNTTFVLDPSVEQEVLDWVKGSYAKAGAKGGASERALLTRVLHPDEAEDLDAPAIEHRSYALHLQFPGIEQARAWNEGLGQSMRRIMAERWGEQALAFTTYLEEVI